MCIFRAPTPPPPAAPLPPPPAPAPPPPVPAPAPLEEPKEVESKVNPQVRRAKSQKAKGAYARGSAQLRVPLKPSVNTGTSGPAGGLNK